MPRLPEVRGAEAYIPGAPGAPTGMRANSLQVYVCLTVLSQSRAWSAILQKTVDTVGRLPAQWEPGPPQAGHVGGLPILWVKTGTQVPPPGCEQTACRSMCV
ncbi:hypothetical protein D623_10034545 [Myotis brandtii]|uniref:Uncharacterized protein n=1 Tax=Myotis brandtii TaxID=109478 RepID=S7P7I7_MYOBR|nr:hypothetical protein D623_10034545 [Myotis brandtii]